MSKDACFQNGYSPVLGKQGIDLRARLDLLDNYGKYCVECQTLPSRRMWALGSLDMAHTFNTMASQAACM